MPTVDITIITSSYRQKNKTPTNQVDYQVYYNITAYDWFQGKREDVEDVEQVEQTVRLRNVSMEDVYVPKQFVDDEPNQVIMKLIPSRTVKVPKVPKVSLKIRRRAAEVVDDSQDRINTFFDNMFPMTKGESSSTVHINRFFCIDDASQTGTGSIKCKICLEEFVSALKLKSHLINHKNLMYKCQYCPLEVCRIDKIINFQRQFIKLFPVGKQ